MTAVVILSVTLPVNNVTVVVILTVTHVVTVAKVISDNANSVSDVKVM